LNPLLTPKATKGKKSTNTKILKNKIKRPSFQALNPFDFLRWAYDNPITYLTKLLNNITLKWLIMNLLAVSFEAFLVPSAKHLGLRLRHH